MSSANGGDTVGTKTPPQKRSRKRYAPWLILGLVALVGILIATAHGGSARPSAADAAANASLAARSAADASESSAAAVVAAAESSSEAAVSASQAAVSASESSAAAASSAAAQSAADAAASNAAAESSAAEASLLALPVAVREGMSKAQEYLAMEGFSRAGLIKQLSSSYGEGFSVADATAAVDHLTVDWNQEAAQKAKEYLSLEAFSHAGLVKQLSSSYGDGFTVAQAEFGVHAAGL